MVLQMAIYNIYLAHIRYLMTFSMRWHLFVQMDGHTREY